METIVSGDDKILSVDDVLKMIKTLMTFPYPQICRHAVAADLLSIMESKGWKCPPELAEAVVRAWDDDAIVLLDESIG